MKLRFAAVGPLMLALCVFALPLHAQTAEAKTKQVARVWYDMSREVTLTGTVSNVMKSASAEMKMMGGAHLIVQTKSGAIDASLGRSAMRGEGALSVQAGESVQVTGVLKTVRGKQVLLTRVVHANNHEYVIRNERGYVLGVQARKNITKSEGKGGQL